MKTKIKSREVSAGDASAQWLPLMHRLRKEMRLTQAKFAEVIGMSKDAVASWEIGRNQISESSALRMSARLGRNIFDGTTNPVTVEELVRPRVREFERSLRRRLGV